MPTKKATAKKAHPRSRRHSAICPPSLTQAATVGAFAGLTSNLFSRVFGQKDPAQKVTIEIESPQVRDSVSLELPGLNITVRPPEKDDEEQPAKTSEGASKNAHPNSDTKARSKS